MTLEEVTRQVVRIFAGYAGRDIESVTIEEIAEKIYREIVLPAIERERDDWIRMSASGQH